MAVSADSPQARYIFGPYEITDTLGHGGMGVVYRATDTGLGRSLAIKILREDLRTRSRIVARFEREAKAFASLDHPNIVHIHSVGTIGKIPYIAMAFIDGSSLADRLQANGPMPWQEAFRIGIQVADALACAHAAGIIHRDIKPGNILMNHEDKAFVTDFGIAKILTATTKLTVDGTRLGTPQYMSPERCRDEAVTPASDLYSLGVLLFQTISGRLPHEGDSSSEVIRRILSESPARLSHFVPDAPVSVERLIAYLLERKPADRPPTAAAAREMLEQVLAGKAFAPKSDEMAHALDAYRRSLQPATPNRERDRSATPTEVTTGLGRKRKLIGKRLGAFGIVIVLACGVLVLLGANQFTEGASFARQFSPPVQNDINAWSGMPSLVAFQHETDTVTLIRHRLAQARMTPLARAGSQMIVQVSEGEQNALVLLDPVAQTSSYLVPPSARALNVLDAFRVNGRPAVLVRTADSIVVLRVADNPWEDTARDVFFDGTPAAAAVFAPSSWKGSPTLAVALSQDDRQWSVEELPLGTPGEREVRTTMAYAVQQMAYDEQGEKLALLTGGPKSEQVFVRRFASANLPENLVVEGNFRLPKHPFQPGGEDILLQLAGQTARYETYASNTGIRHTVLDDVLQAAWTPDGLGLLVVAPDRADRNQLWRVPLDDIANREQLTFLAQGTGTDLVVDQENFRAFLSLADRNAVAVVYLN